MDQEKVLEARAICDGLHNILSSNCQYIMIEFDCLEAVIHLLSNIFVDIIKVSFLSEETVSLSHKARQCHIFSCATL